MLFWLFFSSSHFKTTKFHVKQFRLTSDAILTLFFLSLKKVHFFRVLYVIAQKLLLSNVETFGFFFLTEYEMD